MFYFLLIFNGTEFKISKQFLVLKDIQDQHDDGLGRQSLQIQSGLLVAQDNQGRLEFTEFLNRTVVLAAIHDFKPRLPWFIYQRTQAVLHLWVMKKFENHLSSLK